MRRRLPPGEILSRNLKEAGVTVPEAVRRALAKGYKISNNTLNYILRDETENPGLFTIEAIAVAINKAPEQLAAEFFGIRSDDPNFKGSQFAMLHEFYKGLTPQQKQKAGPFIDGLLLQLQHIKNSQ
jgi:transcriptional regulator with XRE-family HTH domain